jgi:predicted GH43/DUF377 family glycosyl hydrolase
MSEFKVQRLGTLMEPEPGNLLEVEGVLNPAAVRGRDGHLYLFPRMVAKGNYSRIGIARVKFNETGDPVGVERLGIALEPTADYELRPDGGGCEDPRVTYLDTVQHYVMTYVAFGPNGPRIALARSNDLLNWERIGLATFTPYHHTAFEGIDNKDSCIFPTVMENPTGHPELALLHRPLFKGTSPEEITKKRAARNIDKDKECIWISYCPIDPKTQKVLHHGRFTSHERLATPLYDWESLKIGAGTPPVLTPFGWMIIYHGVHESAGEGDQKSRLTYSAGLMILDKTDVTKILYRSPQPILKPELPEETVGLIANVVFPTGIDKRDDIGMPNRFDIYYGMADDRIGVARLDLPDYLPSTKK